MMTRQMQFSSATHGLETVMWLVLLEKVMQHLVGGKVLSVLATQ
jgi:hypothetical protein